MHKHAESLKGEQAFRFIIKHKKNKTRQLKGFVLENEKIGTVRMLI